MAELESASMPRPKAPKKNSGTHRNPRFLMSGTPKELEEWDRKAEAAETNRVAWLRGLANEAPMPAPRSKADFKAAWDLARRADVNAVASSLPPNASARQIASALAKRSGFSPWRVTLDGTEFEAKPPPMPKDWKP